jgi:fatty acid desaturase
MAEGNSAVSTSTTHATADFAELKSMIKQAGLLDKQPLYHMLKLGFILFLFVLSIAFLFFVKPFWLQLFNAAFLGVITTQLGLLGHAAGHRQIFRSTRKNDIVGLLTGNLLVGMSIEWWIDRHNQHHSHPNQHDVDPDVFIPVIAFAPEDLEGKRPWLLNLMKYQAFFFFPMLTLASIDMQVISIGHLLHERVKYAVTERLLMLLHFMLYFGLLFYHFPIWQAILFIVVHQLCAGVYMGSIFAPNHKGMPVLDKDSKIDFLHRQVITARNVHAHPLTDFFYGGLNYQIEHHLFPSMAQNKLKEAQIIIRNFCHQHAIPYYETDLIRSYGEILTSLHEVTATLRLRAA